MKSVSAHFHEAGKLTSWFLVDDGGSTGEVAGPAGPAFVLVVVVERVGGMRELGVGLVARRAGLDGAAVRAVAARPVQRRLQPRVPSRRVRRAPARLRAA